ncbi:MAG: methyltransferase domain-containing protein [Candidatus Limnocylindria bacterium]
MSDAMHRFTGRPSDRHVPAALRDWTRRGIDLARRARDRVEGLVVGIGDPSAIPIHVEASGAPTAVDAYWGQHTVYAPQFHTARASLAHLRWRAREYPLFEPLMELYGDHSDDTVLDYGCGLGNDLVGFLVSSSARHVIGIDVSRKALELARRRLALHRIDGRRVTLVQVMDGNVAVPLDDASVDLVYCEGVLHHTSAPSALLSEFHRVLKPGAKAAIMVYNRSSLYYHLYTAYRRQVLDGAFAGLTIDEAFRRNTDGEECPISRAHAPEEFTRNCEAAGFEVRFVGGYFAALELELFRTLADRAASDLRLADQHRAFLRELVIDEDGYPRYRGSYAGIGGVYHLVAVPANRHGERPEHRPAALMAV